MPLRDHFRPPLDDRHSWDGLHGMWPGDIVRNLFGKLPQRYFAVPSVYLGSMSSVEIDVATFEDDEVDLPAPGRGDEGGGGVATATAVWAPPEPTLAVAASLPGQDIYEVRIYDTRRGRRLVAAVEIVSPSNKDRPESRRVFVAKCATLLQDGVCVAIVDLVTTRQANLYGEFLDFLDLDDPALADEPPPLHAVSCRWAVREGVRMLEAWSYPLSLGGPLPTLPLWLAENFAVPLELEQTYEEACRILRIP